MALIGQRPTFLLLLCKSTSQVNANITAYMNDGTKCLHTHYPRCCYCKVESNKRRRLAKKLEKSKE